MSTRPPTAATAAAAVAALCLCSAAAAAGAGPSSSVSHHPRAPECIQIDGSTYTIPLDPPRPQHPNPKQHHPAPPSFFRQLAQEGEAASASSLASPALDGLLSGDRRVDVLESCLPSNRPLAAAPLLTRGQELVEDNGGTVLALAGPDYCVLAADTRLSSDYRIRTRNVTRLFEVRRSGTRSRLVHRACLFIHMPHSNFC